MVDHRDPLPEPDETRFPAEDVWLDLPCPEVSPDFVDRVLARLGTAADDVPWQAFGAPGPSHDFVQRTLARLREDDAGAAPAPRGPDDEALHAALARFEPPEPAPDFVQRTLARMRREGSEGWRLFLWRHAVPTVSDDFVDRTLAALRSGAGEPRSPRPVRVHPASSRLRPWTGLAAAVLVAGLGLALWLAPGPQPAAERRRVAARATSVEPLAPALAGIAGRGLRMPRQDPLLALDALARRSR